MDGVLIDSEPIWHESEIAVFRQVGLHLTDTDCLQTTGLRTDEMVAYWHRRHPWTTPSKEAIRRQIVNAVIEGIRTKGMPIKHAESALAFVRSLDIKTALASSSIYAIIDAVIERMDLHGRFDVIYSAEEEAYGKPHPGVYLTTAEKLGVPPEACVAIEDSVNGVLSAKAAKMTCIAVPEAVVRHDRRFGIADVVLNSLSELDARLWQTFTAI